MKKLIICTSAVICMAIGDASASVSEYTCKTGDCKQSSISYSGSSCSCDGYMMSISPQYTCTRPVDCAYDDDDTEYAHCYNGWCARVIRQDSCEDYQYEGSQYASDGLFDNTCYNCPAHATCNGYSMTCDTGYYMVYLGQNQQVVDKTTDVALVLGCQKCPAGTGGQIITSEPDAREIWECYATGGTDSTGTYIYKSKCYYDD
ncbi:MAG: hypothetical protein NC311_01790 [Muribaculaceae bacterium]|nr:hypothetical protein [Muribaculaceae bacterium]